MKLTLRQTTKCYGDKVAVDHLNATFENGVYGLLGANGAGKTTLMRMICGILTPTDGEMQYDDKNITDMGEEYRELLGYLPQDFGYYPEFEAREFMLYIAALKGIPAMMARKKTQELLELVGLSKVARKKIKTFSGGMKQRLGIAQAMLNDPKILVLDEPTAGLDPKERVRFRNLISDVASERIVILSTHIVSDVEYIADQIIMMRGGCMIAKGTVGELVETIAGKVWEVVTDRSNADVLCEKYDIINLRHEQDMVELRIACDGKPDEAARPVTPTLEDLYLYEFRETAEVK